MNIIKILFTGVGRRVELIQSFRQAAYKENIELKIYGADISSTAPALAFCDFIRITPHMKSEGYIDELIEICRRDQIDLVIPTIDTDLLVLSQNKDRFGGTKVLISSEEVISICRNKYLTAQFIKKCGLCVPKTYRTIKEHDGTYPCFIKPVNGSSSINALKVMNENEHRIYIKRGCDYVVQSVVEGTEYTVDVFCDFESNPLLITPRIRTQVRSGEVIKTEIDLNEQIIQECKIIVQKLQPVGPLAIQLIRTVSGEDVFIEINGRFGGGAPISMKAGANSAAAVLRLLNNRPVEPVVKIKNHTLYSRYEQSVCMVEPQELVNIQGVIFDLDDTLYSEKQYVRSGYKAVADYLNDNSAEERLWDFFEKGLPAIDEYLMEKGLTFRKAEVLDVYREHDPVIALYEGVTETIAALKKKGIKTGIITDGRVSGQRKKIAALGLDKLIDDIIITDELGGKQFRKPNDIAFRIIQCRWKLPFGHMIYIGDNPEKDALAPGGLGIRFIHFQNPDGLYSTCCDTAKSIDSLIVLAELLK